MALRMGGMHIVGYSMGIRGDPKDWTPREKAMQVNYDAYGKLKAEGKYAGNWIIIQKGVLLGHGADRDAAYASARKSLEYEDGEDRLCMPI